MTALRKRVLETAAKSQIQILGLIIDKSGQDTADQKSWLRQRFVGL